MLWSSGEPGHGEPEPFGGQTSRPKPVINRLAWVSLLLTLLGFIASSVAFSVVVPVLEAPDETSHVATVRFISQRHALPIQRPPVFPTGQEGSQPPLYYLLAAPLWAIAPDQAIAPTWEVNNPRVNFDRAAEPRDNRMLYAHSGAEAFPFQGDVLAIHLIRLLSVALGAATIIFTFLLAREVFPKRPLVMILAPAIVAFNPLFTFMSGVVNNDNAIATTAAFVLWCLARWLRRGGSTRLAVALGIGLALAILSKTSGLLLAAATIGVLSVDPLLTRLGLRDPGVPGQSGGAIPRDGAPLDGGSDQAVPRVRPPRPSADAPTSLVVAGAAWWARVVIVFGLAALVCGWWFIRNQILYGDPLGWRVMLLSNGTMVRDSPIGLLEAAGRLWAARWTYWGIFGWTNIVLPTQIYRLFDWVVVLDAAALTMAFLAWARRSLRGEAIEARRSLVLAMLAGWPVAVFISLVRWVQTVEAADQWRLMFPAVAALGVLLALGIDQIIQMGACAVHRLGIIRPSMLAPIVLAATVLLVAPIGTALNRWVAFGIVAPAYRPVVEAQTPPETERSLFFDSEITLLDYQVQPSRLKPGDPVTVDLTWLAREPIRRNLTVSVAILAEDGTLLAQTVDWPQGGRAPTVAWSPGVALRDHYVITPHWTGPDPQLASVWVSLYDGGDPKAATLAVFDRQGQPLGNGARVGTLKLPATEPPVMPRTAAPAEFGPSIGLLGYDQSYAADALHLTLYWSALASSIPDATVFVHLAAPDGKVAAQHDSPPRGGRYPIRAWESGEIIRDTHDIRLDGLTPGRYRVIVGLYQPASGERLPARPGGALVAVDNGVVLFDLTIPPETGD